MQQDLFLVFSAFLATHVNGHALMGAAFGCCFFLAMPLKRGHACEKLLFTIFSGGIGYSAHMTVIGTQLPMLVSAIVSALAVAIMIPVYEIVTDKEQILDFIKQALSFWRR